MKWNKDYMNKDFLLGWIKRISYLGIILMTIGIIRILFFQSMAGDEIRFIRSIGMIIVLLGVLIFTNRRNGNDKKN